MNKIKIVLTLCFVSSLLVEAQERNLLQNQRNLVELGQVLAKNTEWVQFPSYTDRTYWESLPAGIRQEIIHKGEKSLSFEWPVARATLYLDYISEGDREKLSTFIADRQNAVYNLVMAELIEGKGRFLDQLMDGVWAICEQTSWINAANLHMQKKGLGLPDPGEEIIDTRSSDMGAMLAWTHYFFAEEFDKADPMISEVIRHKIRTKILEPYYTRNDFWWMGFDKPSVNNWNVWVNSNVLQCILLIEQDHTKRTENTYKVMRSIDRFINGYPTDGGCDEGPGYWGLAAGKLFESLEILHEATGGAVDIFKNELIRNMGSYIYKAYISYPYFVNFADAHARININSGMVYRYGKATGDAVMQGFGAFCAAKEGFTEKAPIGRLESMLRDLNSLREIALAESIEPLFADCWFPDLQFATGRDAENSKQGLFFAAKGGHNSESHNHNDVGNFILYYNGLPALIDVGVGAYTQQTFSKERYSIWTMQSGYHNLPVINGIEQMNGRKFSARNTKFTATNKAVEFSLDIAGAYPEEAFVKTWKRSYKLNRGKSFVISDQYSLTEYKEGSAQHFITACNVNTDKPGVVILTGEGFILEMNYNPSTMEVQTEEIDITDRKLKNSWGDQLIRIIMRYKGNKSTASSSIVIKPVHIKI